MAYEAFSWHGLGEQYRFETLEEVVRKHWMTFLANNFENSNFRVIDCYDRQRVDIEVLKRIFNRIHNNHMESYWGRRAGSYEFRNGPVQGTGRRRWRNIDRHPRTLQERRETKALHNDEDLEDLNIKIRTRREKLPTSWDDIPRGDYDHRSWKRHRKTQYKAD